MQIEILLLALAAGALQTFFYCRQLKRVNALVVSLRKRGRVLVGREKSAVRGGALVILRLSGGYAVEEAYLMKGYTAFARVRPFGEIVGLRVDEIRAEGQDAASAALRDAVRRYKADRWKGERGV